MRNCGFVNESACEFRAKSITNSAYGDAPSIQTEDVSLNYVGDFVGDFAPRTYVSMREIVDSKMVAARLFVFIDSD